jgi:hypothetical protein
MEEYGLESPIVADSHFQFVQAHLTAAKFADSAIGIIVWLRLTVRSSRTPELLRRPEAGLLAMTGAVIASAAKQSRGFE